MGLIEELLDDPDHDAEMVRVGMRLSAPPMAGLASKDYTLVRMLMGAKQAEATVTYEHSDTLDPEIYKSHAEDMARHAALDKYRNEYGEEPDWDATTIVINHTPLSVQYYIGVES